MTTEELARNWITQQIRGNQLNILAFSTAWGARHGGINAFNYEFCTAIASQLGPRGKVYCGVLEASGDDIDSAYQAGVVLLPASNSGPADRFERQIAAPLVSSIPACSELSISIWIGHDLISGWAAVEASKRWGGEVRTDLPHELHGLSWPEASRRP